MNFINLIQMGISIWQTLKSGNMAGRLVFIFFDVALTIGFIGMLIGFLRNTEL